MTRASRVMLFADYTLDLHGGRLLCGDQEVPLRPKSFAVLEYLVDNAGRLVSRDELLTSVWSDTIVTDDSLTQCIADIRRALGGDGQKIIRTVPRRGYLFRVPVSAEKTVAKHRAPSPKLFAGGVALLVVVATLAWIASRAPAPAQSDTADASSNSIAVLRFADMSETQDQTYLADGLAEEIIHMLAQVPGLVVIARTSSFALEGKDVATVGQTLNVANVLEGSVRRIGDRVRVTAQLVDAATSAHRWSQTYDKEIDDLFEVQTKIAGAVANAFHITLTAPETRNRDANELMLRAHYYEQRVRSRQEVDKDVLREVVRLYREASEADPESAVAHQRLARALLYLGKIDAAEAAILRALALAPHLSDVQNTLGEFYWASGLPGAGEAFKRAVELNPNNADALHNHAHQLWMSNASHQDGAPPAEQLLRRALKLDPLSLARHAALGDFLGKDGRWQKIPAVIEGVQALFDSAESYRVVAWLYEFLGDLDLSIAWTLRARELEPDDPDHVSKLADLYALIGDGDAALRLETPPSLNVLFQLRRYTELIDNAELRIIEVPGDIEIRYMLAFAYVATDAFDSAIRILSATGLPDSLLDGQARTTSEMLALRTLLDALAGSGRPEALQLAHSLAEWNEGLPWWGDVSWIALYRSCNYVILGRLDDALALLPGVKLSPRLHYDPLLRDAWCFQNFGDDAVYQDVLNDQDARRAVLRARLPATLAQFGVSP